VDEDSHWQVIYSSDAVEIIASDCEQSLLQLLLVMYDGVKTSPSGWTDIDTDMLVTRSHVMA